MNLVREISRYLVGGLFIFSGLIKVNDPVGTQIKLEEYFEVFAYDFASFFGWFIPAALFLSVFLSVLEVILGLALILGYQSKKTAWALLSLIIFFTFLTFYSAYFNKVTDCGCFGDAIKLTPWQSFTKDIILLFFIAIIFIGKDKIRPMLSSVTGHIVVLGSSIVFIAISIIAIKNLPFIDFRSYAVGNNIEQLMQPSGELIYEYILEKDGKEYIFEKYPSEPGYNFISTKIKNPEVQPKITDFSVWNDEGDFTDEIFRGTKLIVVVQNVSKTSLIANTEIKNLLELSKNTENWILTSANSSEIDTFKRDAGWLAPHFYSDATVLKTIMRSSPGIFLLKDGTVVGKWHYNNVPSASLINQLIR